MISFESDYNNGAHPDVLRRLVETNGTQSQSYGPEARGGACKAETMISDDPIGFTKVQHPDFLLALTETALKKYGENAPENCLIMIDDSIALPEGMDPEKVLRFPILKTAKERVGRVQTANVVAVGCINEVLQLVDEASIKRAVTMHVPAGTEEINLKALQAGIELAAGIPLEKEEAVSA